MFCFSLYCVSLFSPFLFLSPLSLSQSSSAAISPQLSKLHQLAMQQGPFPMATCNQGFTGMKNTKLNDFLKKKLHTAFNLHALTDEFQLCISSSYLLGMDTSAQACSHEMTIPNDVSVSTSRQMV